MAEVQHEIRIMNGRGDTKVLYRPEVEEEVTKARAEFDRLADLGYLAYAIERGGAEGRAVKEFDPKEERIVLTPRIAGG